MQSKVNIAVVGATGAVGTAIIEILAERQFPVDKIYPLASHKSVDATVSFGNKTLIVADLATFDFATVDIAFFSAGAAVSKEYVPRATEHDCVVIDNTSAFRHDDAVPLVVPEVNAADIANFCNKNIIANPNCSVIQSMVALQPIYAAVGISRINLATYQAVSGSGNKAIDELAKQVGELLNGRTISPSVYPQQIAFNVLPHIDELQDNGYTREEMKMIWEIPKIFGDSAVKVNATAVRVPVFYGHSVAAHIETNAKITAKHAKKLLQEAPGVVVLDSVDPFTYPTPVVQIASGNDAVYVGRIREDVSCDNGLNLWIVADNVRKGGALNSVQIAEILLQQYF
ncbi:MAG: aspartate-semialdehyde dehydrogenase [Legionellales bacterium]|nr:MAG: aspartate-semialdehyde dehydrogenase [Legionellales bacterium]